MRNLVLFMHTSLDGFVAGLNGEMDWIKVDEEIFDFVGKRVNRADTALYGRVTYEMMQAYWPTAGDRPDATRHDREHSRWYEKVEKIVLSKSMQGKTLPKTTIISGALQETLHRIKNGAGGDILMFGSPRAAHSLMAEELIDEYWLFVNPVLLGRGIPLFKSIKRQTSWTLKENHAFTCGVVVLGYVKHLSR